jgi:integrase
MSTHTIKGYPTVLRLFRPPDSRYWHVRLFHNGKMYKKTTKQEIRKDAERVAKEWYVDKQITLRSSGSLESAPVFDHFVKLVFAESESRIKRGERSDRLIKDEKHIYEKNVKEFFGHREVTSINYRLLEEFVNKLTARDLASASIKRIMSFISKVLKMAMRSDELDKMPLFPTVSLKQDVRGWFSMGEYTLLRNAARDLVYSTDPDHVKMRKVRGTRIDMEMRFFIIFMVNTFLRPSDVKQLQHKHIEIVRDKQKNRYLRINTPFSKTSNTPIVSMAVAVEVYKKLLDFQADKGYGKEEDFIFLPQYREDRGFALEMLRRQFNVVMEFAEMKETTSGQNRTIYSLRHTAIMLRLIKGDNVDLLTLARNARTSVEMIDRFYARHLTAEMNLEKFQSVRGR